MKRIMSLVLTAVILLGCIGMFSVSAFAEETVEEVPTYTTSDDCVKILKEYEGFS